MIVPQPSGESTRENFGGVRWCDAKYQTREILCINCDLNRHVGGAQRGFKNI